MTYDDAVETLFRAPHGEFAAERKRLQAELKAAGDKPGATKLGKLGRPPLSAWTVNQLWWTERGEMDRLFETAERLRDGDLGGSAAHRDVLATLRARGAEILKAADHAATEATLRRIQTTLSALAAIGSFDPDPPGALSEDRDPPGFEAAGMPIAATAERARKSEAQDSSEAKRREEQAKIRAAAERERDEAALRTAIGDVDRRQREVDRLRKATADAEAALAKSRTIVDDLEAKLA